jgi:hypothetical protein
LPQVLEGHWDDRSIVGDGGWRLAAGGWRRFFEVFFDKKLEIK